MEKVVDENLNVQLVIKAIIGGSNWKQPNNNQWIIIFLIIHTDLITINNKIRGYDIQELNKYKYLWTK